MEAMNAPIDKEVYMDITVPCTFCKYFNRNDKGNMTCRAFPNGIPKEIQELKVIHDHVYEGDNGLVYVPLSRTVDYYEYFPMG